MAIHPKHWKKIEEGVKKFEFRRRGNLAISTIYTYITTPVQKITAKLSVKAIKAPLNVLWGRTKNGPGISYEEFLKYFSGKTEGVAFEIISIEKYTTPLNPKKIPGWTTPQSYRILHENEKNIFLR